MLRVSEGEYPSSRLTTYLEHAQDVLGQWLVWCQKSKAALVTVTSTEGGAVRIPGALMALSATGESCGYISGGGIDADVVNKEIDFTQP